MSNECQYERDIPTAIEPEAAAPTVSLDAGAHGNAEDCSSPTIAPKGSEDMLVVPAPAVAPEAIEPEAAAPTVSLDATAHGNAEDCSSPTIAPNGSEDMLSETPTAVRSFEVLDQCPALVPPLDQSAYLATPDEFAGVKFQFHGRGSRSVSYPQSPIDPTQLLKRPSYSDVRLDYKARPHRCDSAVLKGKRPRSLVIGGLGNENFSGHAVFTQDCPRIAGAAKGLPLASNGNIQRAERSGELHELMQNYPLRPGPVIRRAPGLRTSVATGSIAHLVVYQAHQFDPVLLAAEIKRVCAPGAKVSLCGIELCLLDERFEALLWPLLAGLEPLRSQGERLLRREFRGFPLELEDSKYLLTDKEIKLQFATATWNLYDFMKFLRTFPCVQRIEWQPELMRGRSMPFDDLRRLRFWSDLSHLKGAWGSPKKARLLRWPVFIRTGFLPS